MKLSSQKLSVEGYKDQASWIGKLFTPLNQFISQVYSGFNNNLTVEDNFYQEIKDISFLNDATCFPITTKLKFNKYPQMVILGSCITSTGTYPSVQPIVQWSFKDGQLLVNAVSGLTANLKYNVKFLIIYA